MAIEIERKYLNANLSEARGLLTKCGAQSEGIHFETNLLFDTPSQDLRAHGQILRLRIQEWPEHWRSRLTFKAPAPKKADLKAFKAREELEVETGDPRIMRQILVRLGYRHLATYEKIREEWILHITGCQSGESLALHIDLDQLPFCSVIEIEGAPGEIDVAATLLGLDKYEISLKSYHDLNQSWRKEHGLEPNLDFIFPDTEKYRLRRDLGLVSQSPFFS